ncbi:MAG: hypothetical protein WCH74_14885, partial [Chloroflexota bacterium]
DGDSSTAGGSAVVTTDDPTTVALLRDWLSTYPGAAVTRHFLQDPHSTSLDHAPGYRPSGSPGRPQ